MLHRTKLKPYVRDHSLALFTPHPSLLLTAVFCNNSLNQHLILETLAQENCSQNHFRKLMRSVFLFPYQIWVTFYFASCPKLRQIAHACVHHFHCLKEPGKIILKLEITEDAIVDTCACLSNLLLNRGEHFNEGLDSTGLQRLIQFSAGRWMHGDEGTLTLHFCYLGS